MKWSFAVLRMLLCVGPVLSGTASSVEPPKPEQRPDPVATFIGGTIRRAELDRALSIRLGGTRLPEVADKEEQHQFAVRTLTRLIHRRLLLIEAEARGVRASSEEVRAAVAGEIQNRGGREKFEQFLSDLGLSREE